MFTPTFPWVQTFAQTEYELSAASLPVQAGEITAQVAYAKARQTLQIASIDTSGTVSLCLRGASPSDRRWEANFEDAVVSLRSTTCAIESLSNFKLQGELERATRTGNPADGRLRQTTLALKTEADALAKAKQWFIRFGAPAALETKNCKLIDWQPGEWEDACVSVGIRRNGIQVLGAGGTIEMDRKDGAIIMFSQDWDYVVESDVFGLTSAQATLHAKAIYESKVSEDSRYPLAEIPPEKIYGTLIKGLGIIPPRGANYPLRVRPAYVVRFGPDRVRVDARTGECMGGYLSKTRP